MCSARTWKTFRDLTAQLLAADGAVQVNDVRELEAACARLLADPGERARIAANGQKQLGAHRGAAARTAALLARPKLSPCQEGKASDIHRSLDPIVQWLGQRPFKPRTRVRIPLGSPL